VATYLRALGAALIALGVAASVYCGVAARADDAYFRALRGLQKYPNNVLYQTELKMAEPRHMLLLAGAFTAAPAGFVLGSLCLGLAAVLRRLPGPPPR
jgi:hypothetical protein